MHQLISWLLSIITLLMSVFGAETAAKNKYNYPIDSENGGDPFIIETHDGTYYTFTTGGGIDIKKIKAFDNTETIEQKTVFKAGDNGTIRDIWAPELHKIGNRWYIISCAYFNPDITEKGTMPYRTENEEHNDYYRYCFVLESKTEDIFGDYEFKGILAPSGMNNIDGTYLKKNDQLYFVTSSYLDVGHQCITISEMINPYTLKTDNNGNSITAILSEPVFFWETKGWKVNEGPAVLYHNNDIFIVYSASGFSSGDYCLGMLTLTGSDVMNSCSWFKSPTRVLYHRPQHNIYNAGHCNFIYRDDGTIYMVYHATNSKDFYTSPRLTYIREVKFINNLPFFG